MQNVKDRKDDGKPEYTGPTTREAIDAEWMMKIEAVLQELEYKLVDRDTNFGMNEAYRTALDDVAHNLAVLRPISRVAPHH